MKGPFTVGQFHSQVWSADHKLVCNLPEGSRGEHEDFVLAALNEKDQRQVLKKADPTTKGPMDLLRYRRVMGVKTIQHVYSVQGNGRQANVFFDHMTGKYRVMTHRDWTPRYDHVTLDMAVLRARRKPNVGFNDLESAKDRAAEFVAQRRGVEVEA